MIESLRTWSLLRELRAPPGAGELAALQDRLLRAAVAHAYAEVPFYRRIWNAAGFDAPGFRGLEELARIPVVPTDAARAAIESGELLADDADLSRAAPFRTSGASGRPLAIPRGAVEQRLWRATGLRAWLEHGYRWTDVTLRFDSQSAPSHPLQRLGLSRTVWVSNELPLEQRLAQLAAARPAVVVGTPTVLRRVCALAAERGTQLTRPRIVFSQGEILDTAARALVEDVLGVAPVELYGLTEVGYVGWQCERRGALHANADVHLVELLRDERPAAPGELGRVVVTDLRGRTLPLLRYDTGDLAVAPHGELCACGRPLPLLGRIDGRARRTLVRGDGRVVTTRELVEALGGLLAPDRFRVRQDAEGRARLEVAPGENGAAAAAAVEALVGEGPIPVDGPPPPPRDGAEKTHVLWSQAPLVLG
jgi:phenylacetate-CoA ligase